MIGNKFVVGHYPLTFDLKNAWHRIRHHGDTFILKVLLQNNITKQHTFWNWTVIKQ